MRLFSRTLPGAALGLTALLVIAGCEPKANAPSGYDRDEPAIILSDSTADPDLLEQARTLGAAADAGSLSAEESVTYQTLHAEAARVQAVMRRDGTSVYPGSLVSSGGVQSCICTATCQTIVWASNAGSFNWTASGEVSSPSACADAAVATCGNAVASYLIGWSCKSTTSSGS